ncbi:MAG: tandem-95 repeat protein [Halarcobacter sp.]
MASSIVLAGMLVGCGGGGSSSSVGGAGGLPAKGPFKEGSIVTAQKITFDNAGVASYGSTDGTDFATSTINKKGKFSMSVPWTGVTLLTVKGSYLDENTGQFIPGGLLTAVVDMTNSVDSNVNVNILTHVAAKSILASLSEAAKNSQTVALSTVKEEAKAKVAKAFNIDLNGANLEDLDLTNGDDATNKAANTQLLKLSASLLKTSNPEKVLDQIADDLETDDEIDSEAIVAIDEIKQQEKNVDLSTIATNIESNVEVENKVARDDSSLTGKLSFDSSLEFDDINEAFLSTEYTSNEIIVNGIYGGTAKVSISSNASFSKDGGTTWIDSTTTDATINNGDLLKVKMTSSSTYDTKVKAIVTIGGVPVDFKVETQSDPFVADTKITPIAFAVKNGNSDNGEPLNSQVSTSTTVSGINAATPVSIDIGKFSLDGGQTWISSGTIYNGYTIYVRHTTASSYKTVTKSVLTFGSGDSEVKVPFVSVTMGQDLLPDAFTFATQYDTLLSTDTNDEYIVSTEKTISGITGSVNIKIEDGEYSLDSGTTWTDQDGTLSSGDKVMVRHIASKENNTKTTSTLMIGRYETDFVSVTKVADGVDDTTPDEFMFDIKKDTSTDSEITSNSITISGIDADTAISIENGEYSLDNGSTWTSDKGTVSVGDTVIVKHTSSADSLEKTETKLTVGDYETSFISFTAAPADTTPVQFGFAFKNDVALNTLIESAEKTIKGINTATSISVSGGEYSLDKGVTWTSANSTVTDGDTIRVRHTSSSNNNEKTETTLTVGGFSTKFVSQTVMAAPTLGTNTPATTVTTGSEYKFEPQAQNATSWTISRKPDWAIFNTVTGVLSGTPTKVSQQTTYSDIRITAKNSGGQVFIPPFDITVGNYTPVLTPETIEKTITQGTVFNYSVSVEDKGDGETKTFTLENAPAFVSIDSSTGTISGTAPTVTGEVLHTFTIKVTDGSNATDTTTVNLTVKEFSDIPAVPVISGTPTTTIAQDGNYSFVPTAYDDNSANLTFSIENKPSWATFNTTTGELSGTPSNDDVGTYSNIIISVTEAGDKVSLSPFSIEVTDVNDLPTISGTPATTIAEDTEYSFTPTANDVDAADTLTFAITNKPSWATFDTATGKLSGTPTNDDVGTTNAISITVTDGKSTPVALSSFNLEVTNVNDAPVVKTQLTNKTLDENSTIQVDVTPGFEDIDANDVLTYDVTYSNGTLLPQWMSFNPTTGLLDVTPNGDDSLIGDHIMKVTATDESNEKVSQTFTITVTNVNDTPVAVGVANGGTTPEDTELTIAISSLVANDIDADSDSLTILNSDLSNPQGGTVAVVGTNIVFTPTENYNGPASFDYKVFDGTASSANSVTVGLTISSVNDAPVPSNDNAGSTDEDTPITISKASLLANDNDVEQDTLDIVSVSNPQGGTVAISGSDIIFTPIANYNGAASFEYTVNDGTDDSATTATVGLTVNAIDDAPVANNDSFSTAINKPLTITSAQLLGNDTDADTGAQLSVKTLGTPTTGGTFTDSDISDGSIVFTPDANFSGVVTFTYTIEDETNLTSNTATATITVTDNTKPVAVDDSVTGTNEDTKLTIAIADLVQNDTDGDNDSLTISSVSNPINGTVTIVGTNIEFTPDADYNGAASFQYTVNDGIDDSTNQATVAFTIDAVNDAPTFTSGDSKTVYVGQSVSGSVTASDVDNDDATLTYSLGTDASYGSAVVNSDGSYTYTSSSNTSSDSFTIVASDGTASSTPVTVDVTVKEAHVAVDPYIIGAQFCADLNKNDTCDTNEPVSTVTDENGYFTFSQIQPDGTPIIMLGTVKGSHVGVPFEGLLKSSVDNPITSPLTTMNLNGFTKTQIIDILTVAGISGISESDLDVDPMSLFSGSTVQASDYPIMHAIIAVNTFLSMTDYGLTPNVALDGSGDLVSPYSDALNASVKLAQTAINSNFIDSGAQPKIVVYIGVAISNYLVDKVVSMETQSSGSGYSYLFNFTQQAETDYANSDFKALVDLLVANYTADPTKYYALSEDGTSAVDTQSMGAISFTEYGYDFVERKDSSKYTVTGNDVTYDDTTHIVTLTSQKDDATDSISEIKTSFDNKKSTVQATVSLENAAANAQRVELVAYMDDSKHSLTGLFTKISIKKSSIIYLIDLDTYDTNGNKTTQELTNTTLISTGSYVGKDLNPSISVDSSTGVITFTVKEGTTTIATDTFTIPNSENYNLGFTSAGIRSRVNTTTTTPDPRDETTVVKVKGFSAVDLTYPTASISAGDTVIFSDDSTWYDVTTFTSSEMTMNMYDKNNGVFEFQKSETNPITLAPDGKSFSFAGVMNCVSSDTQKVNVYKETVYSDLYRTNNTCTIADGQTETEQNTWNWNWDYNNDLSHDISGLVQRLTDGYTYFQEPEVFMLKPTGEVVLGTFNGYDNNNNPMYTPSTTVVGGWTSDSDSIDVDLSANYKILHSFSLDGNNNIVQSQEKQAGFTETDYIWSGTNAMDFFEDMTGLNVSAVVSNKVVLIDLGGGDYMSSIFYLNGRYVEVGYMGGVLESTCYGRWKEFDTNIFSVTCGNDETEPTNSDAKISTDDEERIVANGGNSFTYYFQNDTANGVDNATITASSVEEITSIDALTNPVTITIGNYTIKAYSSTEVVQGSGIGVFVSFKVNGTQEVFGLDPAHASNGYLMLKVFDSNGNLVTSTGYKAIPADGETLDFDEILSK